MVHSKGSEEHTVTVSEANTLQADTKPPNRRQASAETEGQRKKKERKKERERERERKKERERERERERDREREMERKRLSVSKSTVTPCPAKKDRTLKEKERRSNEIRTVFTMRGMLQHIEHCVLSRHHKRKEAQATVQATYSCPT